MLGVPFDFAAKPVVSPPARPRETVRVHAVKPDRDALEIVFPRVEGYRVELPNERLEATFGPDHVLNLTPELVGPSVTKNQGIIGEGVDLTVAHLKDMRSSTILFHLARHLLYTKYRDPGEEPKLHLFGHLKRITRQWLDGGYLKCSGGTYPAHVIYKEIADMAAERIKAAITLSLVGENPVKAILDALNDGHAEPLNLIVEIKGFRGENAKDKANAMRAYWVPGVNNLGKFGRWAFAEFQALQGSLEGFQASSSALIDETQGRVAAAQEKSVTPSPSHRLESRRRSRKAWGARWRRFASRSRISRPRSERRPSHSANRLMPSTMRRFGRAKLRKSLASPLRRSEARSNR